MRCCFAGQACALLLVTLLLFCGTVMVYLTNQIMGDVTSNIGSIVKDNIDDGMAFIDNTILEFHHIGANNYNFTKNVLMRDVNNIGHLAGVPIQDKLRTEGNVDNVLTEAYRMNVDINLLSSQLDSIGTKTNELDVLINTYNQEKEPIISDLTTYYTNPPCSAISSCRNAVNPVGLGLNLNTSHFPDVSANEALMDTVTSRSLTGNIIQGKEEFENIPVKIEEDTATKRAEIENQANKFIATIEDALKDITGMSGQVSPELDKIKEDVDLYLGDDSYDKYRYYAMIGLECVILLVVILNIVGLVLGVVGFSTDPLEKSDSSTYGYYCLMTSVVFIFIFSWLLMIICTLTFAIGAPIGKVFCHELRDTEYTVFKQLLDGPDSVMGSEGEYPLAKIILGTNNADVPLTYSGMLEGCKNNEPAWSVLMMHNIFDISEITNYQKYLDVQGDLDSFNNIIDLSDTEFFDADSERQLRDFQNATDLDYDGFITQLSQPAVDAGTK